MQLIKEKHIKNSGQGPVREGGRENKITKMMDLSKLRRCFLFSMTSCFAGRFLSSVMDKMPLIFEFIDKDCNIGSFRLSN